MPLSRISLTLLLACAWGASARAQAPAAIVEDITGDLGGVEAMDYLDAGKVLHLGPRDSIVISYLKSCIREIIKGGTVEIGVDQSRADSANVTRARVDCDAGKMLAAPGQDVSSAGYVLRSFGASSQATIGVPSAPAPQFVLYGASPLVELNGSGPLVIARLDRKGEYFRFDIDRTKLSRQRFLDLAAEDKSLTPGGVYGVRWERRLVAFKVDSTAKPGRTPIVGRLLRLGFAR